MATWRDYFGFTPANEPVNRAKVMAKYREMALLLHPNKRPDAFEQATRDFQRLLNHKTRALANIAWRNRAAQRNQAQRNQARRNQARREQAQREQAQREQAQRNQAQREQAQRNQAQRNQAQRNQARRNQAPRARRTPRGATPTDFRAFAFADLTERLMRQCMLLFFGRQGSVRPCERREQGHAFGFLLRKKGQGREVHMRIETAGGIKYATSYPVRVSDEGLVTLEPPVRIFTGPDLHTSRSPAEVAWTKEALRMVAGKYNQRPMRTGA